MEKSDSSSSSGIRSNRHRFSPAAAPAAACCRDRALVKTVEVADVRPWGGEESFKDAGFVTCMRQPS